jgi:hypothetical protein
VHIDELWGLFEVLSFAWKIGLPKSEVQVDSSVVVDGVACNLRRDREC